jgi:tetratricopeptide (TPR) repeat protein
VLAHEIERSRGLALAGVEGHTLLLSAIGLMHGLTASETERARAMLEHLVERGRGQPAPHAWLSHLHALQLRQDATPGAGEAAALARQHASLAVQCDSGSALALALAGQACLYVDGDGAGAQERYTQALEIRPDDGLALLLQSELLALQGDGQAAREAACRAQQQAPLAPLRFLYDSGAALASLVAGEPQAAAAQARRAIDRHPDYLPALRILAAAQVLGGEGEQARKTVQRLAARAPGRTTRTLLASLPAGPAVTRLFAQALREAGMPD